MTPVDISKSQVRDLIGVGANRLANAMNSGQLIPKTSLGAMLDELKRLVDHLPDPVAVPVGVRAAVDSMTAAPVGTVSKP